MARRRFAVEGPLHPIGTMVKVIKGKGYRGKIIEHTGCTKEDLDLPLQVVGVDGNSIIVVFKSHEKQGLKKSKVCAKFFARADSTESAREAVT